MNTSWSNLAGSLVFTHGEWHILLHVHYEHNATCKMLRIEDAHVFDYFEIASSQVIDSYLFPMFPYQKHKEDGAQPWSKRR